jgi:hypothetical protein
MNGNITLNGAGHSILTTSPSGAGIGIRAVQKNGITIRNLIFSGWVQAIVLDQSPGALVEANTFRNNSSTCVEAGSPIYGDPTNRIIRNNVFENNRIAIQYFNKTGTPPGVARLRQSFAFLPYRVA